MLESGTIVLSGVANDGRKNPCQMPRLIGSFAERKRDMRSDFMKQWGHAPA